jgi:DNA-binding transcriptional LysR family regulator
MEISQLRYFKAVAETGKIITAADVMFVTPPTISTSISQLEKELGVNLFIRSGNRLQLSKQGKIFLEYVNQILLIFRRACVELVESSSESDQHISIAVSSSSIWVDFITGFALEYPNYSLSTTTLTSQDIASGLFTNRYAFLLGCDDDFSLRHPEGFESRFLFRDKPAVMVYPTHPFAGRTSVKPEELQNERVIWPRVNQYIFEKTLKLFTDNEILLPTISTYSHLVCQSLVAQHSAIALTTTHTEHKGTSGLVYVPIDAPNTFWNVRVFWRGDRPMSEEELAFKDYLLEYYHATSSSEAETAK